MRRRAQAIGGGATMTKEKADYLSEMREKMGLSKEAAEKVIKGVQNQHLISGLQARLRRGSRHGFIAFICSPHISCYCVPRTCGLCCCRRVVVRCVPCGSIQSAACCVKQAF